MANMSVFMCVCVAYCETRPTNCGIVNYKLVLPQMEI